MSHLFVLDAWSPPSVNRLLAAHWATAARIKRAVKDQVAVARLTATEPIPDATGKRRVKIAVTVAGRSGMPDPDNVLKCLMDALKANRLIVDDSARWCEVGAVDVGRGKARRTVIILEDIC